MKSVRRKSHWDRKRENTTLADRLKNKIKSLGNRNSRKNIYGTDTTTSKKVKLNF